MFLNKRCADMRAENKDLKTQLRFTSKDIEVLVKYRNTQEPFKTIPLDTVAELSDIPPFDHTKKWTIRNDRLPRRKLDFSKAHQHSASGMGTQQSPAPQLDCDTRFKNIHSVSRTSSLNKSTNKRNKQNVTEVEVEVENDIEDMNTDNESI